VVIIDTEWNKLDVHTWDVPTDRWEHAALDGWIAQLLFLVSTCATKSSVLLFYRRIVKNAFVLRWIYAIWAALAFTAIYFITILVLYCSICQPLNSYWLSYGKGYNEVSRLLGPIPLVY
jgi:hypothetical protein